MKTYLPACIIAVVATLLSGCYSAMPNGQDFTGVDPVTKVSASLTDIQDCHAKGGVKVASAHGGALNPPKVPVVCMR